IAALFLFTLSAPALAETVAEGVQLRAVQPVGNGDPNAISCWAYRTTPPVRGLQCARNSDWKRINAGAFGFADSSSGSALGPYAGDGIQSGNPVHPGPGPQP